MPGKQIVTICVKGKKSILYSLICQIKNTFGKIKKKSINSSAVSEAGWAVSLFALHPLKHSILFYYNFLIIVHVPINGFHCGISMRAHTMLCLYSPTFFPFPLFHFTPSLHFPNNPFFFFSGHFCSFPHVKENMVYLIFLCLADFNIWFLKNVNFKQNPKIRQSQVSNWSVIQSFL